VNPKLGDTVTHEGIAFTVDQKSIKVFKRTDYGGRCRYEFVMYFTASASDDGYQTSDNSESELLEHVSL